MKNRRILLPALLSTFLIFSLILPAPLLNTASVMAQGLVTPMVAAGGSYTVGLKSDGTVLAVGYNSQGQRDVGGWTNIVQVAAGYEHTVGLKADGTVVAVGDNSYGQCNVGSWRGINYVATGYCHTVGLKAGGTVLAVGDNSWGECDVSGWNLVLAVPAAQYALTTSSTAGGAVSTPGEGTFTYDKGTVVNLVAEPHENYEFVEWTGDVDTVADVHDATTTITMNGSYSITANFELEEGLCSLTISSTLGGLVTTPGEGIFIYDDGRVVDLVAEAEEGYHFVNWTGNVSTIADVNATATNITLEDNYSIKASFVSVEAGNVSIKAGDWIKLEYQISGWPAGQPYPEWLKVEFLSVEGTSANTTATMHMSDGTEQSDTVPVNLAAGGGGAFGLSGLVIPPNLKTGDSVYMSGFGNVTIAGKTTRTYAGARRTVIYARVSQSISYQGEAQFTYYWDKLTGVMVEVSMTYSGMTATAKATETNMWEAAPPAVGMAWWLWVIIAVAIGAAAFAVYRLRKRKIPTTPTSPTESA